MQKYSQFSIWCTSKDTKLQALYSKYKEKFKKYLCDEDMDLYWIPLNCPDYEEAHELANQYGWDYSSDLEIDQFPNLYMIEPGIIDVRYSKSDYNNAVAYIVDFGSFGDTYEDVPLFEPIEACCEKSKWSHVTGIIQSGSYRIPVGEFRRKRYFRLMSGYAVSEDIKDYMVTNELAEVNDFINVYNKKRDRVIGFQLFPENVITGFGELNKLPCVDECKNCGKQRYQDNGGPYYADESILAQLKGINRTMEYYGVVLDDNDLNNQNPDDVCSIIEPLLIIDKNTYLLLKKEYPRMRFIPVFSL